MVFLLSRRAALSGVLARGVAENSITLTCKKVFIRHLFFLVNLVHLVAIGFIEAGDRLTLKFFMGVHHLSKRQNSMKSMQIKWQTLRHTWAGVIRACLDIGGEALGDKAALSTTANALLVLDDR